MKAEHMVHMVNQIALNVAAYPREDAIQRIANHLQMFWERRMKNQLFEYLDGGGAGLNELALAGAKKLKEIQPAAKA